MKPDLITVWPKNSDFPLWRLFVEQNRNQFDSVFVVIMEPNQGFDYSEFFTGELNKIGVTVLTSPILKAGEDWRNIATNEALRHSKSKWVWFTEQDFFPKGGFFEEVRKYQGMGCQVIAAYQGGRMHPCSIFMRREDLDTMVLDFGIVPDQLDHYGLIQKQIKEKKFIIGKSDQKFYHHFNGFSHNWKLVSLHQPAVYEEENFIKHLELCLEAPVTLSPEFIKVAKKATKSYNNRKNKRK